jgi:hypothetical protein
MPRFSAPRRRFLRLASVAGAAGALGWVNHQTNGLAQGTPPGADTGAEFITPETQAAIDRGQAFLARAQLDDGSYSDRFNGAAVAIAALAGLALMAGGHQPGRSRYGRTVSRIVDYLVGVASPRSGFLGGPEGPAGANQQAMYSHGFGCLFLAEVCGMMPDIARQRRVKGVLEQAIAYTVEARNKDGGWRYEKVPPIADISVTVAQMMALRAAKNAGVFVRKNVVDAGVDFIRGCQAPDGGFTYFKGQWPGGGSAFARSAAAIVGLYSAGIYSGREIDKGLAYLLPFIPRQQFAAAAIPAQNYFYAQYYAALAMWTAGGDYWAQWFPAIRDELLARARAAGGVWTDTHGSPYATAMSLIILQLPNNYLPILQK